MLSLLQKIRFAHRPIEYLLEKQRTCGDVFSLPLAGRGQTVLFSHPQAVREIFAQPPDVLKAGRAYRQFTNFLHPRSVLHMDGRAHRWRQQQLGRLLASAPLEEYAQQSHETTRRAVQSWPTGQPLNLDFRIEKLSMEIACQILFAGFDPTLSRQVVAAFEQSIRPFNNPGWLLLGVLAENFTGGSFSPARRRMAARMSELIQRRHHSNPDQRQQPEGLLKRLLRLAEPQATYPVEAICGDVVTFLAAIYYSVSGVIKRTLPHLAQDPAIQDPLILEQANLPRGATGCERLNQPLLGAVYQESLRLYPSIPIVLRSATEPLKIAGTSIEPGQLISACTLLTHRHPDVYTRPLEFRPQRFFENRYAPHEYYPYGGGSRGCGGGPLAPLLIRAVLSAMFRERRWSMETREPPTMTMRGIFLMPTRRLVAQLDTLRGKEIEQPIESQRLLVDSSVG